MIYQSSIGSFRSQYITISSSFTDGFLILCGESHLNDILRKPIHEALRQRITIHYNYEGLDDCEVSEYILHKLNCAGASRNIISESALGAIHGYSRGNPRLIDNQRMTDALTIGAQQECQVIDDEIILAAVNNQRDSYVFCF